MIGVDHFRPHEGTPVSTGAGERAPSLRPSRKLHRLSYRYRTAAERRLELCSTAAALLAVTATLPSAWGHKLVLVPLDICLVVSLAFSLLASPPKVNRRPARFRGLWKRFTKADRQLLAASPMRPHGNALKMRRLHGALALPAEVTWLWFAIHGLAWLRRPEGAFLADLLWPVLLSASALLLILIFSRVLDIWSREPKHFQVASGMAVDQFRDAYVTSLRAAVQAETSTGSAHSNIRPRIPIARVALIDDELRDAHSSERTAL